ncbi:MAG: hypothetical protein ACYDBT_09865 [Desulfobulbaceae bacterium]
MIKTHISLLAGILISIFLLSCGPPVSYYTDPNSWGYNQQKLGAICEHCGKQFQLSGNQLDNLTNIQCPYCGNLSNTKISAAKWVQEKNQLDQQEANLLLQGLLIGTVNAINSHNNSRSVESVNSYQSNGCSSDYECGIGKKCVKAPLKSQGVCMKTVDEFGVYTYEVPNSSSIGINMDLQGKCTLETDCPVGFRCDNEYKACVKNN